MGFREVFKEDFEGDLEGELERDSKGDFRGDFKQVLEGDWFSIELKFISFELDYEVGRLV